MLHARAASIWILLALGASVVGCAGSSVNLNPARIATGQGALFGHVAISDDGEDVTSRCYVRFTDEHSENKSYLSLDETGWVFTAVPTGPTYLSQVICTVGGLFKHNASYQTRSIRFDVPEKKRIVYFGHVRIELDSDNSAAIAGALIGGVIGALIATAEPKGNQTLEVENKFEAAARQYSISYRGAAKSLTAFDASGRSSAPASAPPRARDLLTEQANLDGIKLTLLGKPLSDPHKVALRFQHYVRVAELQNCKELELVIDGQSTRHPLAYKADRSSAALLESAQAETDLDTANAMAAAKSVEFHLCGLQRRLSPQAASATGNFVANFTKRIPNDSAVVADMAPPAAAGGAPTAATSTIEPAASTQR